MTEKAFEEYKRQCQAKTTGANVHSVNNLLVGVYLYAIVEPNETKLNEIQRQIAALTYKPMPAPSRR